VRLAVAATPNIAIPTLEWIISSEHSLDLVVTRPDKKSGRGNAVHESDVAIWAKENGIPVVKPGRATELKELLGDIDLVVTLAYGVILPAEILNVPINGFINVHFSLLPAWRGAAPVQRAIENGDAISGITVFQLDPGMDTGPTYVFDEVVIDANETAGELLHRLSLRAPKSVEVALVKIARGEKPIPQSALDVSYAAKITKSESQIDWSQAAQVLFRRVRAFNPQPACWTTWRGERVNINRTQICDEVSQLAPGAIDVTGNRILVGCGDSTALFIEEIQPAGKRAMSAKEWLNGARCQAGERFE